MLPLLPFTIGLAAGAAATALWRQGAVRQTFRTTGDKLRTTGWKLREHASSGIDSVRQSGATLRSTVTHALHNVWPAQREESIMDASIVPASSQKQVVKAPGARTKKTTSKSGVKARTASNKTASGTGSKRKSEARAIASPRSVRQKTSTARSKAE